MKDNIRRLKVLDKLIGLDNFYVVTIYSPAEISLQGEYKSDLVKLLIKLEFKDKEINDNGYIIFTRGLYRITLT